MLVSFCTTSSKHTITSRLTEFNGVRCFCFCFVHSFTILGQNCTIKQSHVIPYFGVTNSMQLPSNFVILHLIWESNKLKSTHVTTLGLDTRKACTKWEHIHHMQMITWVFIVCLKRWTCQQALCDFDCPQLKIVSH